MSTHAPSRIGPALTEVCPAFKAKLDEYNRLLRRDPVQAEVVFAEAQAIARRYRQEQTRGRAR